MNLDELALQCHQVAIDHGWWEDWNRSVLEQIALMHSELSEALEEYRKNPDPAFVYFDPSRAVVTPSGFIEAKPEGFGVELADVIIRVLDNCARYKIPIGKLVEQKLEYNRSRPYRHGGKSA